MGARRKRLLIGQCACALLALVAAFLVTAPRDAQAVADAAPDASCARLAAVDPSATSGSAWGKTIFPGHGAAGGWFGVDVCANGFNASIGGAGANVSCSAIPVNWSATGCAPGHATGDGYGLSFQCVELIVRFSAWAFGERNGWFGNAPDLWLNGNHPADFQAIPNGAGRAPVPGDLLVWGSLDSEGRPWPAGPNGLHDGHIAVIAAVRDGQIITAEQNVRWGSKDHPSDVLSLTRSGDHWIVGGTAAPATTLPTYRWPATAGRTRATYGWLHSTRNNGTFPATNAASPRPASPTPAPAKATPTPPPAPTPTRPPTPAPSPTPSPTPAPLPALDTQGLASGVVVTTTGALADLAVLPAPSASASPASTSSSPSAGASPSPTAGTAPATPASSSSSSSPAAASPTASLAASNSPQAQARSLGAPAGIWLASDQTPAVVSLPDGERAVFARGGDGKLYSAVTSPGSPGVRWQALGAPDGAILAGSVSATAFAGGIAVAALASDGNVWWRAGPLGQYGGWLSLGRPAGATLRGIPVLGAAQGSGDLFALVSAWDGHLYETDTVDALPSSDGPAHWAPVALPAGAAPLNGTLLAVPDLAPTSTRPSAAIWSDLPLNVFAMDGTGTIWWLRGGGQSNGWSIQSLTPPETIQTLLAGVAVADPTLGKAAVALHLYAADARGVAQTSLAVPSVASASAPQQRQNPVWRVIAPPASASAPLSMTAIRLGQGLSGLLAADGQRLVLAALPDAQRVLTARMSSLPALVPASTSAPTATTPAATAPAPATATQTTPPALAARIGTATATPTVALVSTPTSTWLTLGAAPLLTTFDDPLLTPQLDPRWTYLGGPGADVRAAPGGMAFAPATAPARTLLLQGTPGRDVAIDAQVTLPASASATARAGLLFYLDDADLLTLSVDRSGSIAFCPTINGQALTCQRTQLAGHPAAGTPILLRLSQLAGAYSGYASLDGDTWTQVGTWRTDGTAQPNDSSQSAATPAATAQANIPNIPGVPQSSPSLFTGMGIFAQESAAQHATSADAATWPRVAGFAASLGVAPSQP